jgi:hypothetical protein
MAEPDKKPVTMELDSKAKLTVASRIGHVQDFLGVEQDRCISTSSLL